MTVPRRDGRRTLVWALLAAALAGFAFGWYARIWSEPSPESRAHDAAEKIRDRVRQLTR